MEAYTVSVQSEDYTTDWQDDLIVLADDEAEAKELAERFIRDHKIERSDVLTSEAYRLLPPTAGYNHGRVIGRLINTDEE